MSNMIECGTCGYPLTPEERTGLVERNGRVVKPWQSLTDEEMDEAWYCSNLAGRRDIVRAIEQALWEKNFG